MEMEPDWERQSELGMARFEVAWISIAALAIESEAIAIDIDDNSIVVWRSKFMQGTRPAERESQSSPRVESGRDAIAFAYESSVMLPMLLTNSTRGIPAASAFIL